MTMARNHDVPRRARQLDQVAGHASAWRFQFGGCGPFVGSHGCFEPAQSTLELIPCRTRRRCLDISPSAVDFVRQLALDRDGSHAAVTLRAGGHKVEPAGKLPAKASDLNLEPTGTNGQKVAWGTRAMSRDSRAVSRTKRRGNFVAQAMLRPPMYPLSPTCNRESLEACSIVKAADVA
jgi:hypothetical protein